MGAAHYALRIWKIPFMYSWTTQKLEWPANVVADCLASLMCDKLLQEVAFENPPTAARGLLLNDLPSVSI
ncbi:hypothetical protein V6N12_058042 [Hibiscus sabdariffa]|uniref:RNase H type-1 domain-containing protein n=1 Tax=Hibiscus sabdariffa TaxID=183260 RepID=A0ABR2BCU6_9ROSI